MTVKAKKRKELRSFRLAAVAAAALAAGFLAWIGLGVGDDGVTELVSNLVQASAALLAAAACFSAAGRNPYGFGRAWTASLHRAWRLLGSAALAWGLGQVAWTILELRGGTPKVPTAADLGYLAAVPLLIAGVLAFPTAPMRATARLRTLLDGLLIQVALEDSEVSSTRAEELCLAVLERELGCAFTQPASSLANFPSGGY